MHDVNKGVGRVAIANTGNAKATLLISSLLLNFSISEFLPDLKRVQIVDFLDVDVWHKLSDFTDVVQEVVGGIALDVCHHALLVRGGVEVPSQLAVEPEAAAALVGVAIAAQGRMVEFQELRIRNVQTVFQVTN